MCERAAVRTPRHGGAHAQLTTPVPRLRHGACDRGDRLNGLDLKVETGEVCGFLGPNGSGKTTTIRILLGLLRPDAGSVSLLNGDPWRDAVELHRRLAYVPGEVSLWPNLELADGCTAGDRSPPLITFGTQDRER